MEDLNTLVRSSLGISAKLAGRSMHNPKDIKKGEVLIQVLSRFQELSKLIEDKDLDLPEEVRLVVGKKLSEVEHRLRASYGLPSNNTLWC